ncbi:MAG: TolC family protein, partial [Kiritimatiellae bacterium]|nr:TolC family protein [Kiritimatiellia bacterium]
MLPPLPSYRRAGAAACAALLLAAGCAHFEPERARREHTAAFTNALTMLHASLPDRPLSLDDCVRLAMTNNYAARQADLEKELLRIGKNVAFTAFLPNVAANAGYSAYAKEPNPSTERRFASAGVEAGWPIFMPSTWFLYAAARHGFASAETTAFYVRQGIVLQTTMNYCEVLLQQDTVSALETQLRAARENAARVDGLAAEGFF